MNYYNEIDPFAANWLKKLIESKLIPDGDVDDRSIIDVEPSDLKPYTQCHFFAGIGGWSYALELSGWDANRPVWSGSCPCQSLSCAGKGLGEKDERHLWPVFFSLIEELRPPTVFGEQVASKDGREWLAGVRNDLEAVEYAVGAADLPACSVSAPHKRNRLFWVANAKDTNRGSMSTQYTGGRSEKIGGSSGIIGRLGNTRCVGLQGNNGGQSRQIIKNGRPWHNSIPIPCADGKWRRVPGRMADNNDRRSQIRRSENNGKDIQKRDDDIQPEIKEFCAGLNSEYRLEIEPALFPLSHGIPKRVGLLRGAGNAIVPQVAAEFIMAYMEIK